MEVHFQLFLRSFRDKSCTVAFIHFMLMWHLWQLFNQMQECEHLRHHSISPNTRSQAVPMRGLLPRKQKLCKLERPAYGSRMLLLVLKQNLLCQPPMPVSTYSQLSKKLGWVVVMATASTHKDVSLQIAILLKFCNMSTHCDFFGDSFKVSVSRQFSKQ